MYAVIRTGGKQYRVAPGDVIRVEKLAPQAEGRVEFADVLAVSGEEGKIAPPRGDGARVVGQVVEEGRAEKIRVFHYKRKKQFKRLRGHRQPYSAVRITEIAFDGQKFTAPGQEERKRAFEGKKHVGASETGATPESAEPHARPRVEARAAEAFGEPGRQAQPGQSRSAHAVESQAGRKPGMAKRTAGAKSQATRAAKGGATKKAKAPSLDKKKKK